MNQDLLVSYARLVVRIGVNLQNDQILVINAPLECADFARAIAKEAFAAGAHDVVVSWGDEQLAHIRYAEGKNSCSRNFRNGAAHFMKIMQHRGRRLSRLLRATLRFSATSTPKSSSWPIRQPVRRSWSTVNAS